MSHDNNQPVDLPPDLEKDTEKLGIARRPIAAGKGIVEALREREKADMAALDDVIEKAKVRTKMARLAKQAAQEQALKAVGDGADKMLDMLASRMLTSPQAVRKITTPEPQMREIQANQMAHVQNSGFNRRKKKPKPKTNKRFTYRKGE